MSSTNILPELKEIIGALLFAGKEPLTVQQIRKVLLNTAETEKGPAADFAQVSPADIRAAVDTFALELEQAHLGFVVTEVAKGFRLENKSSCGPWLREFLNKGKASRLSHPALETLAIIAYRQPVTRSEIEAVRGVAVDAIVKNLLELQLIKVVGRSEMPGRPWLFGTTQQFLLHFGIREIADLPNIEELKKMKASAEADAKKNVEISPVAEAQQLPLQDAGKKSAVEDAEDGVDADDDEADEEEEVEETFEDEEEDKDE